MRRNTDQYDKQQCRQCHGESEISSGKRSSRRGLTSSDKLRGGGWGRKSHTMKISNKRQILHSIAGLFLTILGCFDSIFWQKSLRSTRWMQYVGHLPHGRKKSLSCTRQLKMNRSQIRTKCLLMRLTAWKILIKEIKESEVILQFNHHCDWKPNLK